MRPKKNASRTFFPIFLIIHMGCFKPPPRSLCYQLASTAAHLYTNAEIVPGTKLTTLPPRFKIPALPHFLLCEGQLLIFVVGLLPPISVYTHKSFLHFLPTAAVTNYHRLSGLKSHKCMALAFLSWRPEVWNGSHWANIKVSAGLHFFLEAPGEKNLFSCLFQVESDQVKEFGLCSGTTGHHGSGFSRRHSG